METAFLWAQYVLLGGLVFWLANGAFMLLNGLVPFHVVIVAKTIFLPFLVFIIVRALAKRAGKCSTLVKSYAMLAGVWFFGPVDLVLTQRFAERLTMDFKEVLFHLALFPLSTLIVALYSGALGGLIIATVVLALFPFFCGEGSGGKRA